MNIGCNGHVNTPVNLDYCIEHGQSLTTLLGANPRPRDTDLEYGEDGLQLPEFTGTNDIFWTRRVLCSYFDALWGTSPRPYASVSTR